MLVMTTKHPRPAVLRPRKSHRRHHRCYTTGEALAAFAESPAAYELVITDFEMPGMDGVELCRQLRAISPDQKIILATGSGFFYRSRRLPRGFQRPARQALSAAPAEGRARQNVWRPHGERNFCADLVAA